MSEKTKEQDNQNEARPNASEGADQPLLGDVGSLKAGDTVFIEPIGNNARRGLKELTIKIVEKIGKKYLYLNGMRNRFFIDSLLEDCGEYCSGYRIWLNKLDYDAHIFELKINNELWSLLNDRYNIEKIPIEKKKKILEILK